MENLPQSYSQKSSAYSQKSSAYSQKSSAYSQKSSAYSQKSSAYLSYHFSVALPNFIRTRPAHLVKVAEFFNITELFLHLFTPYRRITLHEKTTFWDKLSFNFISVMVGATVRLMLIFTGIIILIIAAIFDLVSIPVYTLPIFSYFEFLEKKQRSYSQKDLDDTKKFITKFTKSIYFNSLKIFLDQEFINILNATPAPSTLGAKPKNNIAEILTIVFENHPPFKAYFARFGLDLQTLSVLLNYLKSYLENPPKAKITPLGQMLSFGYTNTLDKFSTELTIKALPHHMAKKEMLAKIEDILLRAASNSVILVGEVGVGRHSTLESLASAIAKQELPRLADKRLILLDTTALLGSSKNLLEIKVNFQQLLVEAKHAGNIILALDELDKISSPNEGRIDLTEVLSTTLTDNELPIIALTTTDSYNKYIRPNGRLTSLFEKIDVEEPKKEETISILIGKTIDAYKKEGLGVHIAAIVEIVDKSTKLIGDRSQPEKSIIILNDSISIAKRSSKKIVDVEIVDEVFSVLTKIPTGKIKESEKQKLKDLEGYLHKRIVGQDEAITEIAKALRRARAGIDRNQKTMGAFLFLGPTGVGKTETAKALADAYFGSDSKMVRLDMNEFQGEDSVKRLIGDQARENPGQLTSLVRQNPFGLILLDEFEKANHEVQNLFLQVIDEGYLTDAFGKKVNFENTILIATSNAAAEYIREEVTRLPSQDEDIAGRKKGNSLSNKLIEYILRQGYFSPELINRFDGVVVYHPLSKEEIAKISKLILEALARQLKTTKNITLEITDELARIVANDGYIAAFGARPIKRLIQDKIEDGIAKMIISGELQNGSAIPAATLLKFVS